MWKVPKEPNGKVDEDEITDEIFEGILKCQCNCEKAGDVLRCRDCPLDGEDIECEEWAFYLAMKRLNNERDNGYSEGFDEGYRVGFVDGQGNV